MYVDFQYGYRGEYLSHPGPFAMSVFAAKLRQRSLVYLPVNESILQTLFFVRVFFFFKTYWVVARNVILKQEFGGER